MPITRVSIVEPSGLLYGSELALLEILEALDRSRFSAEVVLPAGSPFSERLRAVGVPFLELLRPMAHRASRLKKLLTYWRLAEHWRLQRPDLIYVNQGGILRPIAAIAKRFKLPLLCQIQTLADARWVSNLAGTHTQVSAFVCNSRFIAAQCRLPKDRLSIVYLGYKPKGLGREWVARPPPPARLEVGLLGRICETKGHYLVIEAARRMKAAGVRPVHFRFVGNAPSAEEQAKVCGLVESAGLADWIEFRGYQTNLAGEFAAMDLLVVPSQDESFGRVFCEAAEAGVPVLLADSGGLGELSRHFQCGERFMVGDVDDFRSHLSRLSADPERCRWEFQVAAARMVQSLDMTKYLAVIHTLICRAAGGYPVSLDWLGEPWPQP